MAIRIRYKTIKFEHYARHRWLRGGHFIKTSEFTKDGSFEVIEWQDYCKKYCDKHNGSELPRYLVAFKTPRDANGFSWYYTIIEKKEPGFRPHEMKDEDIADFLGVINETQEPKGEYDDD